VGSSGQAPPDELDAALIFAPVGALIPQAVQAVAKGGVVVCGGIHMSNLPSSRMHCDDGHAFMRIRVKRVSRWKRQLIH
jgi:D-arabinose 1-dehydrogenase-like Zn-dependent alcohol dehydrogenase